MRTKRSFFSHMHYWQARCSTNAWKNSRASLLWLAVPHAAALLSTAAAACPTWWTESNSGPNQPRAQIAWRIGQISSSSICHSLGSTPSPWPLAGYSRQIWSDSLTHASDHQVPSWPVTFWHVLAIMSLAEYLLSDSVSWSSSRSVARSVPSSCYCWSWTFSWI